MLVRLIRKWWCKETEEDKAIDAMFSGTPSVLIAQMNKIQPPFKCCGRTYYSPTKRITVCDDIYGYEVKIDGGELLDCSPGSYRLTSDTATTLMDAILSNVPSSIAFSKKYPPFVEEK
jgi:hypothetical protein